MSYESLGLGSSHQQRTEVDKITMYKFLIGFDVDDDNFFDSGRNRPTRENNMKLNNVSQER